MRKFRFRTLALLLLLTACVLLVSCGKDDGAPRGFYLVSDPETDGYYFYMPDEWSNQRGSGTG